MKAAPPSGDRLTVASCLVALLVFVAGRCLVPMDETDLFFNLRLGDLIRAQHAVPRTNLLSFTYPDARDINLAWLFQVLLSWVYQHGGIAGTVLLKTAFVLATLATLFVAAHKVNAGALITASFLALSVWAAEPRFVERPHLVTFLCLSLLALALADLERRRAWRLWWLVPWGLLWSNGNSCLFLAVGGLAFYGLGAMLEGRRPQGRWALRAAAVFAPCLVANPSGWHTFSYVANHFRMPWVRPLQEYRTVTWPLDAPFLFLLALFLVVALLRARTLNRALPREASWSERARAFDGWRFLLPLAALALLGALRIRFVAEFALLSGPVTAAWASALVRHASRSSTSPLLTRRRSPGRACFVGACALALALVPKLAGHAKGEPWIDLEMEPGLVPRGAIDYLDAHALRPGLYHDMEVGSYLTWDEASRGKPVHPVFQDPRINGYPEELHAVLRRADLEPHAWQTFLERWNIRAALLCYPDSNPRAPWFAPSTWALVYRSADALVFVRRDADVFASLARDELPLTFMHEADGATLPVLLTARPDTLPLCLWHQRRADFALETPDRGHRREALRAYAEALAVPTCLLASASRAIRTTAAMLAVQEGEPALSLALAGDEASVALDMARGLAHLGQGSWSEAEAAFTRALEVDPAASDALFGGGVAREKLGQLDGAATRFRALLAAAPRHAGAAHARAFLEARGLSPDLRGPSATRGRSDGAAR